MYVLFYLYLKNKKNLKKFKMEFRHSASAQPAGPKKIFPTRPQPLIPPTFTMISAPGHTAQAPPLKPIIHNHQQHIQCIYRIY